MTKKKIADRITAALAGRPMRYADLARKVFPEDEYPNAFNYAHGNTSGGTGGPPGCYMALSRAIREMGLDTDGYGPTRTVFPTKRA